MSDELHEKALKDALEHLGEPNFSAWVKVLLKIFPETIKKNVNENTISN